MQTLQKYFPPDLVPIISEYCKEYSGKSEFTLNGHQSGIHFCCQIADERILSCSADCTLKIWNLKNQKCELTLVGHTDYVWSCCQLQNRKILSASYDGTLKIWNLETGECEITLIGHSYRVVSCCQLQDGRLLSASEDCTLKIWNVRMDKSKEISRFSEFECELTLKGHNNCVFYCCQLQNSNILSVSDDNTQKIWNQKTGECHQTFTFRNIPICVTTKIFSHMHNRLVKYYFLSIHTYPMEHLHKKLNHFFSRNHRVHYCSLHYYFRG